MNTYFILKWLHILSATILFGTGIGIAFFKWIIDRRGDTRAIRIITEYTVLADWIFTAPAVILQFLTGITLVFFIGYPITTNWIFYSILLYFFAGCCWVPVVWLQIRMREIAKQSDDNNMPLPPLYWQYNRIWFWLGIPAFGALVIIFWLMITKFHSS
jgi:uncharacterized membrane protein